MRFPAALSVAFFALGTVAAHADFDLKLACRVSKVPSGAPMVPKDIELEIDLENHRAKVRDEVISETNVGWLFVDGVSVRKGTIIFGYAIRPSVARISRLSNDYRNEKIRYTYWIDPGANTFRLTVKTGSHSGQS